MERWRDLLRRSQIQIQNGKEEPKSRKAHFDIRVADINIGINIFKIQIQAQAQVHAQNGRNGRHVRVIILDLRRSDAQLGHHPHHWALQWSRITAYWTAISFRHSLRLLCVAFVRYLGMLSGI